MSAHAWNWRASETMNRSLDSEIEDEPRRLTDSEASRHVAHLQQLINESESRVEARFAARVAAFEKMFIDSLGEAFSKERRKIRAEMKQQVDDLVTKTRTGPQGARGAKGDRGEYGARGAQGKQGPQGKPGVEIARWKVDKVRYAATPFYEDGSPGPELELRSLFEQFVADLKK